MSVTAVCIRPIGTDLVALSAFDTFVRKMGYEGPLLSLTREELWILDFDLDDTKAIELTRMLVDRTGIFVNPNTHTHVIVCPDEMLPHGRQRGREELAIAVWSREDPQIRPVAVAVTERMGVRSLKSLRRLVLWWPRFAGGEGVEGEMTRKSEIASSMVATYSRKEGLLANPHYQCWSIIEKSSRPRELLATIGEIEERVAVTFLTMPKGSKADGGRGV
jgi:hypothetical protein